ncbi:MAG: hypothetical protein IJW55_03785 [Clostridia bacterium]|nr:hypothetical protein [Clostridia bacterium]
MKQEKNTAGEIVVKNRFLTWLDNFWYHYKWPVIVIGFFVFVGIVCFAQCSTKETGDVTLAYAGNYTLSGEERERVIDVFNAVAPEKEKDGRTAQMEVLLTDYSVYTEDELRPQYTDAQGNVDLYAFNNAKQVSNDNLTTFGTYVMTGEAAVWLVSEYVYEQRNLAAVAVPLSELFETLPESACNDYAIRLGDTALYKYYDALKVLPADTLIVMPHSYVWGASSDAEKYEEFKAMYYAIVNFQAP